MQLGVLILILISGYESHNNSSHQLLTLMIHSIIHNGIHSNHVLSINEFFLLFEFVVASQFLKNG